MIYVVSDGIETCGGDPVAVARDINRGSTRAIVNIIGFGLPSGEAAVLRSVAAAGGGQFVNVTNDSEFERTLSRVRDDMRRAQNRVAARMAQAGNSIATGAKAMDAVQCTGRIASSETKAALDDYDIRAGRGERLPPRYLIVALLRERHADLFVRRDAHLDRLNSKRDTVNRAVEADRLQAR